MARAAGVASRLAPLVEALDAELALEADDVDGPDAAQIADGLVEDSPFETVDKAVTAALADADADADASAAVPNHQELVQALRERWDADELLQECAATPSDASSTWSAERRAAACASGGSLVGSQEVVYRVRIGTKLAEQEYHVLGSTTLEAFRGAVCCAHDHVRDGSERFGNFCFFVAGTLYCSARGPGTAEDLSAPIRDWAQRTANVVLRRAEVAGVTFAALDALRIGERCLFLHQGDCEHLLEVVSVHLGSDLDPREASLYPMLVFSAKARHAACMCCCKAWARYACEGDGMTGELPLRLCAACFRSAFYSREGKLLERFRDMRAAPYLPDVEQRLNSQAH